MSNFNPDLFMQTSQQIELDTEFTAIPGGDYRGIISDLKAGTTPGGNDMLNVTWLVDDENVREFTGMPEPTCRQTIWLDIGDDGLLETGANKNVGLGKLREALGQNDPNAEWSPSMLMGQGGMVHIEPDKTGKYTNVTAVAPL